MTNQARQYYTVAGKAIAFGSNKTPQGLTNHAAGIFKRLEYIYSDTFRSYHALDVSEFKHFRINHSKQFAEERNHMNGIENFWNQAKRHLRKFNGVPKRKFHLFLRVPIQLRNTIDNSKKMD